MFLLKVFVFVDGSYFLYCVRFNILQIPDRL